jgi:hypothetical protein
MIEKFKDDLNNLNIKYENLILDDITFEFYFKEYNYLIFIINPNIYNEKTINIKFLYNIRKKLDELKIDSLFIFQPELSKNYDIYWNRFLYKFNISNCSIHARKCEVKEIPNDEYKSFLKKYHLQGYVAAKIKLGLYHNNELVSLMSFSVPRFSKNYDIELARYCSKSGYKISGGASKIFKHFINNYTFNSVISYSDMMIGGGYFYEKLGFIRNEDTGPGFNWYYPKTNLIYHRRGFWKNELDKKLENFDPSVSAHNNMRNNGYVKVFNLGNNVFTFIKNNDENGKN